MEAIDIWFHTGANAKAKSLSTHRWLKTHRTRQGSQGPHRTASSERHKSRGHGREIHQDRTTADLQRKMFWNQEWMVRPWTEELKVYTSLASAPWATLLRSKATANVSANFSCSVRAHCFGRLDSIVGAHSLFWKELRILFVCMTAGFITSNMVHKCSSPWAWEVTRHQNNS